MKNETFNATITERRDLSEDLMIYKVKPDFEMPAFLPGQYVALGVCECDVEDYDACAKGICHYDISAQHKKLIKRAYSVSSPPSNKEYLEFYIALVPKGAFTNRMARLDSGARIFIAPKIVGTFTLRGIPESADLVFVATGTGIAPFMSMLRDGTIWDSERKIYSFHGARYRRDLAYESELRKLAELKTSFHYHPILSREQCLEQLPMGHVQDLLRDAPILLNPELTHVLLCGNPNMISDVQEILEQRGFKLSSKQQAGNIHIEKYW